MLNCLTQVDGLKLNIVVGTQLSLLLVNRQRVATQENFVIR